MFANFIKSRMVRVLFLAAAPMVLGLDATTFADGPGGSGYCLVTADHHAVEDGPGGSGYCLTAQQHVANDSSSGSTADIALQ